VSLKGEDIWRIDPGRVALPIRGGFCKRGWEVCRSKYKTIDERGLVVRDVMANGLMGIMELEHGTP